MPLRRSSLWSDPRVRPSFGTARVNPSHPLAPDLMLLYNEGGGDIRDPLTNQVFVRQNGPLWVPAARGLAIEFNGTTQFLQATVASSSLVSGSLTVVTWFLTTSTTAFGILWETIATAGNNNLLQCYTTDAGIVRCDTYNSAGTASTVDTGAYVVNQYNHYAVSLVNGGTLQAYINGLPGTSVTMTGSRNGTGGTWKVGATASGSNALPGQVAYTLVYKRALGTSDLQWLRAEPYAFLQPVIRRRYFVPAAVGATWPGWVSSKGGWF